MGSDCVRSLFLHTSYFYTPSGAILGDRLAMVRDFCDRGREAGREGREVGEEGAGSWDRGGGKWGSSTPLSTPTPLALTDE